MTVKVQYPIAIFEGNGTTSPLNYDKRFLDSSDLIVTHIAASGDRMILIEASDYTVSGAGDPDGGQVVPISPIAIGDKWEIARTTPLMQPTDYSDTDGFPADSHELALDRQMMIMQELVAETDNVKSRSLLAPVGQTAPDLDISGLTDGDLLHYKDGKVQRLKREQFAGKYYAGDATGRPTPSSGLGGGDEALRGDLASPAAGSSLVIYYPGGLLASSRSIEDRLRDSISIKDKTITGNDIAPAAAAIIADIGGEHGDLGFGEFFIPRGRWNLSETILSEHQSLQIAGRGRPILTWTGDAGGTMFDIRDSSAAKISNMVLLGGGLVPDKAIYYNDTGSGIPDTPFDSGTNELLVLERLFVGRKWGQNATVYSGINNGFNYGLYVGGPNLVNNDSLYVRDSQFYDCAIAGVALLSNQSIWNDFSNFIADSCGYGIDTRSNLQGRNLGFNRNKIADLRIRDNTIHDIDGFNSENAKLLVEQSANASLRITGGKAILSSAYMTGDYYATFSQTNEIDFSRWWVDPFLTTGKKLLANSSTTQRGNIKIVGCRLPAGDTRDGYELNAPPSTVGLFFQIQQGSFNVTGRLDGSKVHDFTNMSAGSNQVVSQAQASGKSSINVNVPVLVSFPISGTGLMLTGNSYAADLCYARFAKVSGSDVDLSSSKLRWRVISEYEIKARAAATGSLPASLAVGDSAELTATVPCSPDDFVYWAADKDTRLATIAAYVQSADTAKLNVYNTGTGAFNFSSYSWTLFVVRREMFDYLASEIKPLAEIADGETTSITISVPGLRPSDHVMVRGAFSGLTPSVQAGTDQALVVLANGTGVAWPSGSIEVEVGGIIGLS